MTPGFCLKRQDADLPIDRYGWSGFADRDRVRQMPSKPNEIAAINNAAWCAAVWRAHGLAVERRSGMLICPSQTPRLYPNAVTFDPGESPQQQRALLAELSREVRFAFSVKDSFNALELDDLGFDLLFQASWIWREPGATDVSSGGLLWKRIDADQLANWETAWKGVDAPTERTFPDRLMQDDNVRVLAGVDARSRIVAGLMAYEAAGVVGITNVFGPELPTPAVMAGLASDAPLVGYEGGTSLATIQRQGFVPVGDLAVWVKPPAGT